MESESDLLQARQAIAASFRAEMARNNLSIAELGALAQRAGIASPGAVRRYWNGERDMTWGMVTMLCKVAGVDPRIVMRQALAALDLDD